MCADEFSVCVCGCVCVCERESIMFASVCTHNKTKAYNH